MLVYQNEGFFFIVTESHSLKAENLKHIYIRPNTVTDTPLIVLFTANPILGSFAYKMVSHFSTEEKLVSL